MYFRIEDEILPRNCQAVKVEKVGTSNQYRLHDRSSELGPIVSHHKI